MKKSYLKKQLYVAQDRISTLSNLLQVATANTEGKSKLIATGLTAEETTFVKLALALKKYARLQFKNRKGKWKTTVSLDISFEHRIHKKDEQKKKS